MTDTIDTIGRTRHVIYVHPRQLQLESIIYPDAETRSVESRELTKQYRKALQMKGFQRDDRIRYDGGLEYRTERWIYSMRNRNDSILLFVPAMCKVYNLVYVTEDHRDSLIADCARTALRVGDGYQLLNEGARP